MQNVVLTAGLRDGKLNVFDMRSGSTVRSCQVHSGAVNMLSVCESSGLILTGSADKSLKLFDLRGGSSGSKGTMEPVVKMEATDAIFCGETIDGGKIAMVGCGDGNILAFDT